MLHFRRAFVDAQAADVAVERFDLGTNLDTAPAVHAKPPSIMAVAKRHCNGHVISCLEGGYELSPLARSVAAHVKVLASV